jgi:hypothetical protein
MLVKVIDNVISNRYSQFIFEEIVKLKWTFVPNLSYSNSNNTDHAGFSYNFYLDKNYSHCNEEIRSNEYNYVIPLLLTALEKFDLDVSINQIFRSRVRLTMQRDRSIIEDKHRDYNFQHLVLLYYVNSTDGDTVLFDNNGNILEKISPRRGRCVLFDGSIEHASSTSTLSPRIVLNNNILINI